MLATGRSDRDKNIDIKRVLLRRTYVVHNMVHTCARTARSAPSEMHRIRLKMHCSEQGERWRHGFLIRGSGVRIPPRLPLFSVAYTPTASGVPTFVPTFFDEFLRDSSSRRSMASAALRDTLSRTTV